MKNIRFYTIAVLFCKLPTPKVNRCLHMDIRHLISESHAISCLPEFMNVACTFVEKLCMCDSPSSISYAHPSAFTNRGRRYLIAEKILHVR